MAKTCAQYELKVEKRRTFRQSIEEEAAKEYKHPLPGRFVLLAVGLGNKPLGYVTCCKRGEKILFGKAYIIPRFRRKGIATKLTKKAFAIAKSEGKTLVISPAVTRKGKKFKEQLIKKQEEWAETVR